VSTAEPLATSTPDPVLEDYLATLARSALLSANTRRAYAARVTAYMTWLAASAVDGNPLTDPHARDGAVRDYRSYLKNTKRRAPETVNAHISALVHFYEHLGLGAPGVKREHTAGGEAKGLSEQDQRRVLRAVERLDSTRDQAMVLTLFYTGARVAELVGLDVDDIELSARLGVMRIRAGKGDRYRKMPLHTTARDALRPWLAERADWPGADGPALFLNRRGGRLTTRAVGHLIDRIEGEVGIEGALHPHVLRHTFGRQLARSGVDLSTIAELMGHSDINTTRIYTRPTADEKAAALDRLVVDE
jgi:site-specific recombinase XerD